MSSSVPQVVTLSLASFKSTPVVKKEKKYMAYLDPEVFKKNCEVADAAIQAGNFITAFAAMENNGFRPQSMGERAVKLALTSGGSEAVTKYLQDFCEYIGISLDARALTGRAKHFVELLNVSAAAGKDEFEKARELVAAHAIRLQVDVPEQVAKAGKALERRFVEPKALAQKDWKVVRAELIQSAESLLNAGSCELAADKLARAGFAPHVLCMRLITEDPNHGQPDAVSSKFMMRFADYVGNGLTTQDIADKRVRHLSSFLELKAAQDLGGFFLELKKLQDRASECGFSLHTDLYRLISKVERVMRQAFRDQTIWGQLGFVIKSRNGLECTMVHETTGHTIVVTLDSVEETIVEPPAPAAKAHKRVRERKSRAAAVEVEA